MIFSKVKSERNEELNLEYSSNYVLYDIDGLSPVSATINTTEFATSDGAAFNSSHIGTRNIVLYIQILEPIETNRLNLYKIFKIKSDVTLYFRNDSRNVFVSGKVESFELDHFSNSQVAQISIICSDPFFKSTETQIVEFSNVIALFEFPFSIAKEGIEFSRLENVTTKIINAGEMETGITIQLFAGANEISNPVIYNNTNNTYFGLNFDMLQGDLITITTQFNNKKVTLTRDAITTNILYAVQSGSTWLTLESGENEITFYCDKGENDLTVTIENVAQFEGI